MAFIYASELDTYTMAIVWLCSMILFALISKYVFPINPKL